jgi:L-ascorbate metabolism protein UlaG (beta-lactamase superfamily)
LKIHVTHSSTACVLIEIGRRDDGSCAFRLLTDPVFDTGTHTYPFFPFPLSLIFKATRSAGPLLAPSELPPDKPINAVLLSHAHHGDNLDCAGKRLLHHAREVITSPKGYRHLRYQLRATGLKPWSSTTLFGQQGEQLRITATPAHHRPRWLPEFGDQVVGFLLEWGEKPGTLEPPVNGAIYLSGDTVYFRGIEELGDRSRRAHEGKPSEPARHWWRPWQKVPRRDVKIGTALLHLGAVRFLAPGLHYTFNAREAARVALEVGAKTVVPIHYEQDVWDHFKETQEDYTAAFSEAGAPSLTWLPRGRRVELEV